MSVIKFKVWMEDYPEVVRIIDAQDKHTFAHLHLAILESVGFDDSQLASFFLCNEEWEKKYEITLIDMDISDDDPGLTMAQAKLGDYILKAGEKLRYEYDFVLMWKFMLEVEGVSLPEESGIQYPAVRYSEGEAPDQYNTEERYPETLTEEDQKYINELRSRNSRSSHGEDDDDIFGSDFEDSVDDDDLESFGDFSDEEDKF